ncbi:hypothetical protein HKI87_14g77920 [Chloropicon roscoffensis]|uniref:F-box domain-containing protein n=1 Tax=Chloropicon roscoffensis TaxID=1461544 RepID=A0AAX4PJZ9_9CHLO
MVPQKRRRGEEGTDTEPASVEALRQENEELREERDRSREEVEGLKLRIAKLEAGCKTPQEEDEEVKLPTEMWAIIAGKIKENDVCSFALVSKQLREAQVLAGRKLATRPRRKNKNGGFTVTYFTEDWYAYWSRKFSVHHTDPELIRRVLCVAAYQGYLQVFEKYWSQGPQEKLSQLWDERTCCCAAYRGHLEVLQWLRAKGCPWGRTTSKAAADGGRLEVLQWMRGQDPPCPWTSGVCLNAAQKGHLDVLRWARSQGCPWNKYVPCAAAKNGHLKALKWLIKEGCPYDKSMCREAAVEGGRRARKVLEWLDE